MTLIPDHQSMSQPDKFFRLVASGITEWVNDRTCPDPQQWQRVIAELLSIANDPAITESIAKQHK